MGAITKETFINPGYKAQYLYMAHVQDGKWSWLVCFSATLSWLAALGFVFSFGIFFPVFMDYFNESREKTGKLYVEYVVPRFVAPESMSHGTIS